ncbi:hypothetical protein O181_085808 [Austropuccinia psidii MF-1]|uniref:Uncharacterized protein n=1 Tax=Austropuccinia psidii MF-1 TaxID=1389203 RepID=A0A9Q3FTV4_9BASI|nr:hypothetical protein [Austropuccinia psidii MF-1]
MDQTKLTPKETMVGHQDNPATNKNQECSKKRNVAISIKQEQENILSSPGIIQKQSKGIETQPLKEIPGRGGTSECIPGLLIYKRKGLQYDQPSKKTKMGGNVGSKPDGKATAQRYIGNRNHM